MEKNDAEKNVPDVVSMRKSFTTSVLIAVLWLISCTGMWITYTIGGVSIITPIVITAVFAVQCVVSAHAFSVYSRTLERKLQPPK